MILMNRLLQTTIGWSSSIQMRMEKALEGEVEFYPNPKIFSSVYDLMFLLQRYGTESIEWLYANKDLNIERIFFMDSMQNPYGQLFMLDREIDFNIMVHVVNTGLAHSRNYYLYNKTLPSPMVMSNAVGNSYGFIAFKNVGGVLNPFMKYPKENNTAVWAGSDINNPIKNFPLLCQIAIKNPKILFYVFSETRECECPSNIAWSKPVSSVEYQSICKSAKYIVSTSVNEGFGYAVFDAISVGCIPICHAIGSFKEYLPEKFLYTNSIPVLSEFTASMEELENITNNFSYKMFKERLLS